MLPETIVGMIEASTTRRPRNAVHPQPAIDHCRRACAHLAGADRVENRRADIAGLADEIFVAFIMCTGQHFLRRETGNGARLHQAADVAERCHSHGPVSLGRQIVRPDLRSRLRIGRLHVDGAAAFRSEIADRNRDRGEAMQRLAQPVSAQRLDMVFEIGRLQAWVASGEDTELARRHRQRSAATDSVFDAHGRTAEQIVVALV